MAEEDRVGEDCSSLPQHCCPFFSLSVQVDISIYSFFTWYYVIMSKKMTLYSYRRTKILLFLLSLLEHKRTRSSREPTPPWEHSQTKIRKFSLLTFVWAERTGAKCVTFFTCRSALCWAFIPIAYSDKSRDRVDECKKMPTAGNLPRCGEGWRGRLRTPPQKSLIVGTFACSWSAIKLHHRAWGY